MVRTFARLLDVSFNRIQFTPDLMPSDITGTNIYQMQSGDFHLVKGPVFTDFLLADEINRTPAKTQSALLEAMEERQSTIDGVQHVLSDAFMVFATMNPIEYEGTYPLPEAQLDRFLLKLIVDYPSPEEEDEILRRYHQGFDAKRLSSMSLEAVANFGQVQAARQTVREIRVDDAMLPYIRKIVEQTRKAPEIFVGGGPRASIAILLCAKALAALNGRDYVNPDDIKACALPVLRHRLILEPEVEVEGLQTDDVIKKVVQSVPVPR